MHEHQFIYLEQIITVCFIRKKLKIEIELSEFEYSAIKRSANYQNNI